MKKKTLIELMATPFHSIAHGLQVLVGGTSDPLGNAKKRNLKKLISIPFYSIAYAFEVITGVFCDVLAYLTNKKFIELLSIPYYSVAHGFQMLAGGICDILQSVKNSFRNSPKDELGGYAKDISKFADWKLGGRLSKHKKRRRRRNVDPTRKKAG